MMLLYIIIHIIEYARRVLILIFFGGTPSNKHSSFIV